MIAANTLHDLSDWITHLNWVDFVFLVVLVYSVVTGAWLGFMAECVSLAGIAAGVVAAGLTYNGAGSLLGHLGVPAGDRDWAGFVAVFLVISLIFRSMAFFARKLSRIMIRGWSNTVAGGLIGLLAGAMLCMFAFVTVAYFGVGVPHQPYQATEQSKIASASTSWLKEFVTLLPEKMHTIPGFLP